MRHMSVRKEILIIKNISRENSGILHEILNENGIKADVIDLSKGEEIRYSEKYGAVVVLGGPDSANDETPKIKKELALIRKVLDQGIPYLGICLGMQTMVKAAGGRIIKCKTKEIGFRDQEGQYYNLQLTEYGRNDPLFYEIDDTFNVFQLHGETVLPAENIKLLAKGKPCRNQIIKAGSCAYGIQCHFELTPDMFNTWINEDPDLQKLDNEQLCTDFDSIREKYSETGRQLFRNFLRLAGFI
jgi:GMP synthase (glutamine-hydrolysing)